MMWIFAAVGCKDRSPGIFESEVADSAKHNEGDHDLLTAQEPFTFQKEGVSKANT